MYGMWWKDEDDYYGGHSYNNDSDDYENDFDDYNNTEDYTQIFLAVHNGDLNRVTTLLKKNNLERNVFGRRMLHVAAARGHLQIVDLLIKNGAKINVEDYSGRTPFFIALKEKQVEIAEFLMENGACLDIPSEDGKTPLHLAIKMQNLEIVERLLKKGAKVNVLDDMSSMKPIDIAAEVNDIKLVEILLKYGAKEDVVDECYEGQEDVRERMTALHFAAKVGNLEMVKLLMSNGFDKIGEANEEDETPLCLAVVNHHLEVVKYMIESGGKIEEDLIDLCGTDEDIQVLKFLLDLGVKQDTDYAETILSQSFSSGQLELWKFLLTCYSKVDAALCAKETELHSAVRKNEVENVKKILNEKKLKSQAGKFALYIAVENGNEEIVKILLEAGCSLESCFGDKLTPLHIAVTFEHTRLAELLLKHKGDINSETKNHIVPLDFAAAMGHLNMIRFLVLSGAKCSRKSESSALEKVLRKSKLITPSQFQNKLKITELLLFAGDLKHRDKFHIDHLLNKAINIRIENETEPSVESEEKKGEFRPEIVRALLNYLTKRQLAEVLNLQLHHNNESCLEFLIEYYDSKFIPEDFYFSGNNWSDLFIISEMENGEKLLNKTQKNIYSSALTKNDGEVLKLIIARLELLAPNFHGIIERFNSKDSLEKFRNECRLQIINMQNRKITDELNLNFCDILIKDIDVIANCIRDEELLNIIEHSYDKFPAYGKFLKLRIEKAKRKIDLIDMSTNCLFRYIEGNYKIQFSTFDIEKILQYLSMSDLRKLTSAFNTEPNTFCYQFVAITATIFVFLFFYSISVYFIQMDSEREDVVLSKKNEILNDTQKKNDSLFSDLFKNNPIGNHFNFDNDKFFLYTMAKDSKLFKNKENSCDASVSNEYKTLIEKIKNRIKSPLIVAIEKNNLEVVKQLLNNINVKTVTPLLYAAKYGHLEIVKLLCQYDYHKIEIRKGNSRTPLYFAVRNGHIDVVKYLIANNAKRNLSTKDIHFLVRKCILNNRLDIVKCLIDGNMEDSPSDNLLHYSATHDRLDIFKYLVERGVKINMNSSETPLHCAVRGGHTEIVREILSESKKFQELNHSFGDLIHIAAEKGNEEIFQMLIEFGCSVENYFKGKYPIHIAAAFGHWKLIEILLKSGVDINSTTDSEETPLHIAIVFGQFKVVKFLLDSGARPLGKNIHSINNILSVEKWLFGDCIETRSERQLKSLKYLVNYIREEDLENCLTIALKLDTPSKLIDVLFEYNVKFYYIITSNLDILEVDSDSISLVDNIIDMNILIEFLNLTNLALTFSINTDAKVKNKNLCQLLVARIVLMKSLENYSLTEIKMIKKGIVPFKNYYEECKRQLLSMKEMKIDEKYDITYYDILIQSIGQVSKFVKNVNLLDDATYSAYNAFLKRHIEKGRERRNLIETSYHCLFVIVQRNHKIQLPIRIIGKIFEYLSVIHMRKLLAAYF
ncbi:ankyrin-3-like [Leptopilina heterotoma]|uniref:ankyrin-3-like n=1 Tax=Leptopilina heterotoma TaxID=63436 RepID=UPI001CA81C4D|nr:ankyrin-3-like [Leptopilina heterotoma]